MTACTNHGGKARRVVTAALVGVLSVGTVPMVALATGGDDVSLMATNQESWQAGDFKFNVSPNADGSFTVDEGDVLSIESVTSVDGQTVLNPSEVTVLFFQREASEGNTMSSNATATNTGLTIDGHAGSMPVDSHPSSGDLYWVVVFEGDVVDANGDLADIKDSTKLSDLTPYNPTYKAFKLSVQQKTTSIADAQVFEFNASSNDLGVADSEFAYTGGQIEFAFQVNGKYVDPDNYNIVWTSLPEGVSSSIITSDTETVGGESYDVFKLPSAGTYVGTYKATITAKGADYTGTADVSFDVKAVNLSSDSVSIAPSDEIDLETGTKNIDKESLITVNGTALVDGANVKAELIAKNGDPNIAGVSDPIADNGMYTFKLTPRNSASKNVIGETTVNVYVVDEEVTYLYAGSGIAAKLAGGFNPALGSTSRPTALDRSPRRPHRREGPLHRDRHEGRHGGHLLHRARRLQDRPRHARRPGLRGQRTSTPATTRARFTVSGADYSNSKLYVSYNGKNIDGSGIEYTGSAIEPTVVVRNADNETLTEGTDYSWKLVDAEGNEVESATEVGDYKVVVTYNGSDTGAEKELAFSIVKANIESAKPTADFFGIPEEGAATPTFLGYTQPGCKGQEFALDASEISVRYYTKLSAAGIVDPSSRVNPEDLTEEGTYYASISILSTAKNIKNTGDVVVEFELSKVAHFADVDANAWYAQVVAKAYDNEYIHGIAGTNLFAPEADITRADVACILFNDGRRHQRPRRRGVPVHRELGLRDRLRRRRRPRLLRAGHRLGPQRRRRERPRGQLPPDRQDHPRGVRRDARELREVQGRLRGPVRRRPRRHARRLRRVLLGHRVRRLGRRERRDGQRRLRQGAGQHHPRRGRCHGRELPARGSSEVLVALPRVPPLRGRAPHGAHPKRCAS